MISIADVTAVVVTDGYRNIKAITDSLAGFGETIVFDNSKVLINQKKFGKFQGMRGATKQHVYVQDDEHVVDAAALAYLYNPDAGEVLVNDTLNLKTSAFTMFDCCRVGTGVIAPKFTVEVFGVFWKYFKTDQSFLENADLIFTSMNRERVRLESVPTRRVDHLQISTREQIDRDREFADLEELLRKLEVVRLYEARKRNQNIMKVKALPPYER